MRRTRPQRFAVIGVVLAAIVALALVLLLGKGRSAGEAELGQQRAHLALVASELYEAIPPLRREVAAARVVWPHIYKGLGGSVGGELLREISAASEAATEMPRPKFLEIVPELTGPGSRIARLYESFLTLSRNGWSHVREDAEALNGGPPAAAAFARSTSGLYVESIYDSLFDLTSIGEKTLVSYERFGGGKVFGSALTPSEAQSIAKEFSAEADELEPHEWQALQVR